MSEFLTTRELAALLRVRERKVYDLVAQGALPFRKVTGKLLFPRKDIETWLGAGTGSGGEEAAPAAEVPRALVVVGGHDPLLEWALRASRSGIAAFFDGALDGLERAAAGDCIAAGVHIPDGEGWNVAMVAERFGQEPWVLLEWVRRKRGLMFRPGLKRAPRCLKDTRGLRFQARQPEAASELVLERLLKAEKLSRAELWANETVERSETDLAMAIAGGRADVGLGIEAAARQFNLDFVPLVDERFDLLVWRKAYFDPPFQRFVAFCRTPALAERAHALGGYDLSGFGRVHFNAR